MILGCGPRVRTRAEVRRLLNEVRRHGIAISKGELLAGFNAVSAPVFDSKGVVVAAVAAAGRREVFDIRPDGANAVAVKKTAALISSRLGYSV